MAYIPNIEVPVIFLLYFQYHEEHIDSVYLWLAQFLYTALRFFQTFPSNNPMMPFLCDKLEEIIRCLMLMIIVKNFVDKANIQVI